MKKKREQKVHNKKLAKNLEPIFFKREIMLLASAAFLYVISISLLGANAAFQNGVKVAFLLFSLFSLYISTVFIYYYRNELHKRLNSSIIMLLLSLPAFFYLYYYSSLFFG